MIDAESVICSNERMLTGPAACGGYFFGCLVRKRNPSLTLFARDNDPDRLLIFEWRSTLVA